jgi:hypothetical protein
MESWKTKYGVRRVRYEPPTIREALFAAEGLTADIGEQMWIAAALIGVPLEEVRVEARKLADGRKPTPARAGVVVVRRKTAHRDKAVAGLSKARDKG